MKFQLLILSLLMAGSLLLLNPSSIFADSHCASPANSIVAENCKPGNPDTEWKVPQVNGVWGDPNLEGFADDISYNLGSTVNFKVRSDSTSYRIDIYRLGYYQGNGARKIISINPAVTLPQSQPECIKDNSTGLIDCGNWSTSASWEIPSDSVSGVYIAKLVRLDPEDGRSNHIFFVVRDDNSNAPILFQTSDTTWQAYNYWGKSSLYFGPDETTKTRAVKVSYNRPFGHANASPVQTMNNTVFIVDHPMLRYLERNGYEVSYSSGVDTDRRGSDLLNHKVFLAAGHDEYWSGQQFKNVEIARDNGVNLAFFTGNAIYWKTRFENSIVDTNQTYRTLITYREAHQKSDPIPNVWTGQWRDPVGRTYEPTLKAENSLSGSIFVTAGDGTDPLVVLGEHSKFRFWRHTPVANLKPGERAVFPFLLGYEWDVDLDNGFRPEGLFHVSVSSRNIPAADNLYTKIAGPAVHHLSLYRAPSGALVFTSGSFGIVLGLDQGNGQPNYIDQRFQQAVVNLLADMGVQPASLQSNLVATTQSTDTTKPSSTITSPTDGAALLQNNTLEIKGTASDVGGEVAAVEVSTDNGTTWHPAYGRNNWKYNWTPTASGQAIIKVRAVDDSGNIEPNPPSITVNITANSQSKLQIYAAGAGANGEYPTMEVYINNSLVRTFTQIRGYMTSNIYEVYSITMPTPISADQVRIAFVNDFSIDHIEDRNLYIDKIVIDGVNYPTVASDTYTTGTNLGNADGTCTSGDITTRNVLNCNGYFQFKYTGATPTPPPPGNNYIWGIDRTHQIFYRNGINGTWNKMIGSLKQLSVGQTGQVWGANAIYDVYYKTAINTNWIPSSEKKMAQLELDCNGGIWATDAQYKIYNKATPAANWTLIEGSLKQISAGNGDIWGVNALSEIYYRNGLNGYWRKIPGSLKYVDVDCNGEVWGVNGLDQIYHRSGLNGTWRRIEGSLSQISISTNGDIWGVNGLGEIYYRNGLNGTWQRKDGTLTHISVKP